MLPWTDVLPQLHCCYSTSSSSYLSVSWHILVPTTHTVKKGPLHVTILIYTDTCLLKTVGRLLIYWITCSNTHLSSHLQHPSMATVIRPGFKATPPTVLQMLKYQIQQYQRLHIWYCKRKNTSGYANTVQQFQCIHSISYNSISNCKTYRQYIGHKICFTLFYQECESPVSDTTNLWNDKDIKPFKVQHIGSIAWSLRKAAFFSNYISMYVCVFWI